MIHKYILFISTIVILLMFVLISKRKKYIEKYTKVDKKDIMDNYNKAINFHFSLYSYNGPPHYSHELIKSTSYETTEQALLLYYLEEADNVIELGANIGTSSILISKILKNSEKQHVAVEPNIDILKVLEKNKILNKSKFNIIPGIVSPKGDFYLEGDGWGGHIVKYKTDRKVKTFDFYELDAEYNFNVLFADCEGSLKQLLTDYPNIHKNLRLVIYERDGVCNYSVVDSYFHNNKFKNVYDGGHHCVFIK
uniref:Methyltransferase FkbM domain-containing protein n=1 Tax=Megaviridae environmental sample TaxID=1737588 RepID=A0A5J6VKG7_9VIRU|nr:MAG: hypothetical protein [Megaviridae environmental sample]